MSLNECWYCNDNLMTWCFPGSH